MSDNRVIFELRGAKMVRGREIEQTQRGVELWGASVEIRAAWTRHII